MKERKPIPEIKERKEEKPPGGKKKERYLKQRTWKVPWKTRKTKV
jgi:hypothetical protein